jgi:hypothetical protein
LGVHCNMPMAQCGDLKSHRGLPDNTTCVDVLDTLFVICKIEIVHEPHIRRVRQRHFDNFSNLPLA